MCAVIGIVIICVALLTPQDMIPSLLILLLEICSILTTIFWLTTLVLGGVISRKQYKSIKKHTRK